MFNSPVSAEITPRPGESMTAAIFRQHDSFAGTGLTATDQTAIIANQQADAAQKLTECAQHNAELMIANRAHLATIRELRDALTKANELNADLQEQLEEARANAASDASIEVAWALHFEGIR